MTSRVRLRPEAESDLLSIALYVADSSFDRADQLVAKLIARCDVLAAHPMAGRARPDLGEGLRSLSERPYLIVYRIGDGYAEVVAFIHGARDLPSAMRKRLK